jgi:hypothetical protein
MLRECVEIYDTQMLLIGGHSIWVRHHEISWDEFHLKFKLDVIFVSNLCELQTVELTLVP